MAGLQQYNFFPTDLLYPRPQPSPSSLESASVKPSAVPFRNPNLEISQDLRLQEQQKTEPQHPSKHALFYNRKKQQQQQPKYSINPLSLVVFIEDGDDSVNN